MKKIWLYTILLIASPFVVYFLIWGVLAYPEKKIDVVFCISNTSQEQPEIPLRLIVDEDTIYDQKAKFTNITPDLQYIENVELTKGQHQIIFEVSNTEFNRTEKLDFDNDKWIFLSYGFKKPADSLTTIKLNKKFDGMKNVDSIFAEFYDGLKPNLTLHTMETEPIHH